MTTTAIIVALVVLIVGIRIVIRRAWADYSKPFFSFDDDQARRDIEEALSNADSEIYTRQHVRRMRAGDSNQL